MHRYEPSLPIARNFTSGFGGRMAGASASTGCEGGGGAASPAIVFVTIDPLAHPPSVGATNARTSQRIEKRISISEDQKLMFLKLRASG